MLHACEAVTSTYNSILVVSSDTYILLLLLHFIGDKQEVDAWMEQLSKVNVILSISEHISQLSKDNIIGFQIYLTAYYLDSSFHRDPVFHSQINFQNVSDK